MYCAALSNCFLNSSKSMPLAWSIELHPVVNLVKKANSAISASVAPFIFAAFVWKYTQYGHFIDAATAKPISSLYLAGIFVSPKEYSFISAHSCGRVSGGIDLN